MPQYEVTTKQIETLHNYLSVKRGKDFADFVCNQHPKVLTDEHVASTGGGCKAFILGLQHGEEQIVVVWTDDGGMDLPEGTGTGDYLCGVYKDEISDEPIVMMSGWAHRDFPL